MTEQNLQYEKPSIEVVGSIEEFIQSNADGFQPDNVLISVDGMMVFGATS